MHGWMQRKKNPKQRNDEPYIADDGTDLEHPIVYTPRSIEVQQARIKEGEFYKAFLENLEKL